MASQAYRTREKLRKCQKNQCFPLEVEHALVGDDGIEPPTCPV
jgi:hypothetical protein